MDGIREQLYALAPRGLSARPTELTFDLPGIELEPARVRKAITLLRTLTAPVAAAAGPYR